MQELPGMLFNHKSYCYLFKFMISSAEYMYFTLHKNGYENKIYIVRTSTNSPEFWIKLA